MKLVNLLSECPTFDFKLMLEEKTMSWLKCICIFANGLGGFLFFSIDNDGVANGLTYVQHVCETISSKIRYNIQLLFAKKMIVSYNSSVDG